MTKRIELQHCQYGVPASNNNDIDECGEPAVAKWTWDNGEDWLYVCEKHDILIEKKENED